MRLICCAISLSVMAVAIGPIPLRRGLAFACGAAAGSGLASWRIEARAASRVSDDGRVGVVCPVVERSRLPDGINAMGLISFCSPITYFRLRTEYDKKGG